MLTTETIVGRLRNQPGGHMALDRLRASLRVKKDELTEAVLASPIFKLNHGVVTLLDDDDAIEETIGSEETHGGDKDENPTADDDSDEEITEEEIKESAIPAGDNGDGGDDDKKATSDDEDAEDEHKTFRFPEYKRKEYAEKGGNCGDEMAARLTDFLNVPMEKGKGTRIDVERLMKVAYDNGLSVVNGANPGQQRMNLSNVLRGMLRKGHDVDIDGYVIEGEKNPPVDRKALTGQIARNLRDDRKMEHKKSFVEAERVVNELIDSGAYEVLDKGKLRKHPLK